MSQLIAGLDPNNTPKPLLLDSNGNVLITDGTLNQNKTEQLFSLTGRTTSYLTDIITNTHYRGGLIIFTISAVPGVHTVQFTLRMSNNAELTTSLILQDDAQVGTITRRILVYPGAINTNGAFDKVGSFPMPAKSKIQIVHNNTGAFSYECDIHWIR